MAQTYAQRLQRMLNPKTIAVIGASDTPNSVGKALMDNLKGSTYAGRIFPVNPKYESVGYIECVKSIADILEPIDLVIIATPAATVKSLIESCNADTIGGAVVISSGFLEIGKSGEQLSTDLLEAARKKSMPILGPNCLGFMRPKIGLNATFSRATGHPGKIAFISQSGALCTAILDWANKNYVGFSAFVSIGDMVDIGFSDLIDYFAKDEETGSIILYMESITKPRQFLSAARAASRVKPVIVLKSGKSVEGTQAARSHTGSIAGNDRIFDAIFKRAGMLRVETIGELFDAAETLDMQHLPYGKNLAIITNAGGPGVIATDALISLNGSIAQLSEKTKASLNEFLPSAWSHGNPIDILGDADSERYKHTLSVCLNDPGVDAVLIVLTPQAMTDPEAVAHAVAAAAKDSGKIILASWMGENSVDKGREILEQARIPSYRIPEHAVRCFMNMFRYRNNLSLLYETPATIPHAFSPNKNAVRSIIDQTVAAGRSVLLEHEAKAILTAYDIPVVSGTLTHTPDEAVAVAQSLGYPVVLKISSPDILHKTDVGGKLLGVTGDDAVRAGYQWILTQVKEKASTAHVDGILVEQMVSKKFELIIGCKKDPIFGPAIVFGMGGVAVDVFNDTTIGFPPLNMALSLRLIEETKIYKLLKGYRGMAGVDISAIQYLLYKFAYLVMDFAQIKEIDINPFSVDERGGIVLDAKIILDNELGKLATPYSHLVISPYPSEYIATRTLANGETVTLRPIRPEDEPLEAAMFKTFSKETERFRFFGPIKDITHDMLIRYTQIDYDRELAIVAIAEKDGEQKMLGVVRIIADAYNDTAEFAIVVGDPWQGKGLGRELMDYILQFVQIRKIKKIFAHILPDNSRMLQLMEKRGFVIRKTQDAVYAEKMIEQSN